MNQNLFNHRSFLESFRRNSDEITFILRFRFGILLPRNIVGIFLQNSDENTFISGFRFGILLPQNFVGLFWRKSDDLDFFVGMPSEFSDEIPTNNWFQYEIININVKPDIDMVTQTYIRCLIRCELIFFHFFFQFIKSSTNISTKHNILHKKL